ncbi:MAG: glycosyl hydrolase family 3 [Oscillospiraceae bacterium]|nr:glycosyl hydrolase family 3 [Oscillospiraceae bacterium]
MDLKAKPFYLNDQQLEWVFSTLSSMSEEEKAGQLFCVMGGDYSPEKLLEMVSEGKVGSVLFRPVKNCEGIKADFAPLDAAAKIPLLKAANLEEGGSGAMSDGTLFGWPMLSAASNDEKCVENFAAVCAEEGKMCGINWSFSPVCDLDLNYANPITNVRSFGSDTDKVMRFSEKYVSTMQSRGMAACAKHFPGDGVDHRDHHLHVTVNSLSADKWYETYGAVYENLIAADLMSVMVGHIAQPNVARDADGSLSDAEAYAPASMSPTLLQKVLRGTLGFNGLITSDATIMGGFCMHKPRGEAIPAAIMAGCDMLVFSTDFEEDYGFVLSALADGSLSRRRLDEAVTRILALKAKVCFAAAEIEKLPAKDWHRECADKAITLVKNKEDGLFPITPERYPRIRLIFLGKDAIPDGSVKAIARAALEKEGFGVELYEPMEDDLHGSGKLSSDRLTLYIANCEQASNQTTVRLNWCPKHALDIPRFLKEEPCVFVSLANPYHLQDVPMIRTYINAYTATETTIKLCIEKLMGRSEFKGLSPVDPFCGLPDTML